MAIYNVQISDPNIECGGLRFLTVKSDALGGRGDITVYAAPGSEKLKNVPLVLLLHGVYDSHWAWVFKGGAHLTAARLIAEQEICPVLLAMPADGLQGDGTGYVAHSRADYERWIIEDVVQAVRQKFSQVGPNSSCYIGGLSMGGFGALRLGAKYAGKFAGISAHSAGTHLSGIENYVAEDFSECIATEEKASALFWLVKNKETLPPLRFDCGTADKMLEGNRRLHRALEEQMILHEYQEFAGGHDWNYWQRHVSDSLRFFARCEAARNEKSIER